jgi:two-component system, NtrC family, sensor kinase
VSTVLVLDDSLTVRMDLVEAFESAGLRAVACASVAEARAAMQRNKIDVAVLDVVLPDGDGIALIEELRALAGYPVPVLVLSSEAEVKDRVRGLQTGANEYIGKPYDAAGVVARARALLAPDASAEDAVHVVVIDDSATYREQLSEALTAAGYRVTTAQSGEEGLRLAADVRPDALIVDGVLPGIDGATVIRRVRLDAAQRSVVCVLLTASEDASAQLRALDAGADAFVRKDEDVDVILARLAATVRAAPGAGRRDHAPSVLGPKRILAVDDSATYLNGLAEVLRLEGHEVLLARSGEEALELLSVQRVDCILLDLLMPGLGGRETCARIKAAPMLRDIPLVMLTALEERDTMLQVLGAGADDYIPKSCEVEVLKARVRAQLRRKQFEDEHRRVREELLRKELEASEARAARELAETRATLVEELERKNRELEAFSYSVSHDLRAPLRGIDGFSQAIAEDYADRLDARGLGYLQRVRAAAQRMGELIDDLLELSRVGRAELVRQRVNLAEIAQSIASDLQRTEPTHDVAVTIGRDLHVDADARLMRAVMENLLGNAWKFTCKTPSAQVDFFAEDSSGERVFVVRDNGAGFDPRYVDKLFAPFQRLHTTAEFPGTGIGLATVQRIVSRHGGRIWASGQPGSGASIYFTLPSPRGAT